jgi:signal transduction histidine kinase
MRNIILGPERSFTVAYFIVSLLITALVGALTYAPMSTVVVITAPEAYAYEMPERLYSELLEFSDRSARYDLHEGRRDDVQKALDAVERTYKTMVEQPEKLQPLRNCESFLVVMSRLGWFVQIARESVDNRDGSLKAIREDERALREGVKRLAAESAGREAEARLVRFDSAHAYRLKTFCAMLAALMLALVATWAFLRMWRTLVAEGQRHGLLMKAEQDAREAQHQAELALHTFLGKVSHEINSPLQTILTNIQLMEARHTEDSRFAKIITRLKTSVTQLRGQIMDLLDVSEIKSGKLNIKLEPVDVAKLVQETVSGLQGNADIKGLTLTLKTENLIPAQLDGRRVGQIITNLVCNAIRYTEQGEVYVTAHMLRQDGRLSLSLMVADTGVGMSVAMQEQLFQPFMRNSGAKRKGTGLGLSIVKGLVEQLQGDISFASTEGFGTEFYVTLPLLEVTTPVCLTVPEASVAATESLSAGGKKVLFADDDEGIRDVVTELLSAFGYNVTVVASAADARQAIGEQVFGIILLDMELGDGNGADVAVHAKMTANSFTPIVAMTAYPELYKRQMMKVFSAQLGKPVDAALLRSTLVEVCMNRPYHQPQPKVIPPFPGYHPEASPAC